MDIIPIVFAAEDTVKGNEENILNKIVSSIKSLFTKKEDNIVKELNIKEKKAHFKADEKPEFDIDVKDTAGNSINDFSIEVSGEKTVKARLVQPDGKEISLSEEIKETVQGLNIVLEKGRSFKPGLYKLMVETIVNGVSSFVEQDFTWGVLAVNVNKSIYLENEDIFIGIAVLDDLGYMVCDASVRLEITDPLNQKTIFTTNNFENNNNYNEIKISPECEVLGVTNLPDYYTNYSVNIVGNYIMNLTAVTSNGVRSIIDSFEVRNNVDFDVAKKGPTRIYPYVPYYMNITINVNNNYNGIINEYIPASFEITPQENLIINIINDTKVLSWDVKLKKDDTIKLYYEFDAPDISPEFYSLGALDIGSWKEIRNWQIASDTGEVEEDDTSLIIFDEVDARAGGKSIFINQTVKFYANYSNSTTGISTGNGNCSISFNDSIGNMTYKSGIKYYEFNRTFNKSIEYNYTVICVHENYTTLIANDSIEIIDNITVTKVSGQNYREDCSSGTCVRTFYPTFIDYYNGSEFKEINTSIYACNLSSHPNWQYCNEKGLYKVYFRNSTDEANQLMAYEIDNNTWVKSLPQSIFYWNDSVAEMVGRLSDYDRKAELKDGDIFYRNAFGTGFIFGYQYIESQLKKKLRIRRFSDLPAVTKFSEEDAYFVLKEKFRFSENLRLYIDDILWDQDSIITTNKSVEFKSAIDNSTVIKFAVPYAEDNNGTKLRLTYVFSLENRILKAAVLTPYTWLNASSRAYPVLIDPSIDFIDDNVKNPIIENGTQNLTIDVSDYIFENISFVNSNISTFRDEIIQIANPKDENYMELFSINPTLEFEYGNLTRRAKGTKLYKCSDWNFTSQKCNGYWEKIKDIIPGEYYTFGFTATDPGYAETGLIALNTYKSIYLVNETALVAIGVLDEKGFTICDANVTLLVIKPDGSMFNMSTMFGNISVSSECFDKGKTYVPDYSTNFSVSQNGTWLMNVSAKFSDLNPNQSTNFDVLHAVEFDVERFSATRIYPLENYTMNFTIIANSNYTGNVTEYVPTNFSIILQENLTVINVSNTTQQLIWNVSFVNGSNYTPLL